MKIVAASLVLMLALPGAALAQTPPTLRAVIATHVMPPYPPISVRLSEQGTVVLHVTIGPDGAVMEDDLEQSSGSDRLDQAALDYVKANWRWEVLGPSGTRQTLVSVKFHLTEPPPEPLPDAVAPPP